MQSLIFFQVADNVITFQLYYVNNKAVINIMR